MFNLDISIAKQTLSLFANDKLQQQFTVATSALGPGEQTGSFKTPRGAHCICEKIGAGAPENTVFVGRQPTGEIYTPALGQAEPDRDWILTRILWLEGEQTPKERYIYIHGCPDEIPMGKPSSHGCIRMHNADVMQLFELVSVGTAVNIS